jgi:hypothetical protein
MAAAGPASGVAAEAARPGAFRLRATAVRFATAARFAAEGLLTADCFAGRAVRPRFVREPAAFRPAPVELRFEERDPAARDFFLAAIPSTSQGIERPRLQAATGPKMRQAAPAAQARRARRVDLGTTPLALNAPK